MGPLPPKKRKVAEVGEGEVRDWEGVRAAVEMVRDGREDGGETRKSSSTV